MEELWTLDQEQFENLKPVHGLIFLFKWVADDQPMGTLVTDSRANDMFFAKQVTRVVTARDDAADGVCNVSP